MRRFDSVEFEQVHERLRLREIAEDPHRRVGRALAQRRRERDLVAFAAPRIRVRIADVDGDAPLMYNTSSTFGESRVIDRQRIANA